MTPRTVQISLAIACSLVGGPLALPAQDAFPTGSISFFLTNACPQGWSAYTPADGRMIVPVEPAAGLGRTVLGPLPPGGRMSHLHAYGISVTLRAVSYIALGGGGNRSLTASGTRSTSGNTGPPSGDIPYAKLLICKKDADAGPGELPTGATAFFEAAPCPDGWNELGGAAGRFLQYSRDPPRGNLGGAPLTPAENRTHSHSFSTTVSVPAQSVALAGGCCAGGYGGAGSFQHSGNVLPVGWDIPYIQLLQCEKAAPGPPVISAATNGASFESGAAAPGELVTLFGENLGPAQGLGAQLDENGNVARQLGDVRVIPGSSSPFANPPTPLFFVREDQINLQIPYEVTQVGPFMTLTVERDGVRSAAIQIPLATASPGLFKLSDGSNQAIVVQSDGGFNSDAAPARRGETVLLFGTGHGLTIPASATGVPAPMQAPFPRPILPVTVEIDEVRAQVEFAGAAPGFVGLLQLNVVIPDGVSSGLVRLSLRIGEARAQQDCFLWIE